MFSRFFIDRPIFAPSCPSHRARRACGDAQPADRAVSRDRAPVVTVQAVYPGASAETLEQTVAAPLENQITGVEKMIYMSSTSARTASCRSR